MTDFEGSTPTRWKLADDEPCSVVGVDGSEIAETWEIDTAVRIVAAVNNYDRLKRIEEAAREVLRCAEEHVLAQEPEYVDLRAVLAEEKTL